MRWLGMTAAVVTLIAVVMNSIWFVRRGLGFGGFVSMAWPAALATTGVVAFALLLGFVSVRAMNRAGGEDSGDASGSAGAAREGSPRGDVSSSSSTDGAARPIAGDEDDGPRAAHEERTGRWQRN